LRGSHEASRKQLNIEPQLGRTGICPLFFFRQQIEKQRAQPRLSEMLGNGLVSRASATAPAAVGENHDAGTGRGFVQFSRKAHAR
jgi:hypothetical protein